MPLLQLLQFCWNIVFGQLKFASGLETVATGSVRTEHCIYRCIYLYLNASCVVYPIHVQCHVEAYMFVNIKSVVFLESRWFLLHVRNNWGPVRERPFLCSLIRCVYSCTCVYRF